MNTPPTPEKPDPYKASSFRAFNEKWPERYDSSPWVRFWTRGWDDAILAELPTDAASFHILDIGCATGRLLSALARAGIRHLYGTDLAPRIIAVAHERFSGMGVEPDLRVADAEDTLPWPNASFHIVTLTGVIHHFFRPVEALREIHRVLREKGELIIIDPWFPLPVRAIVNLSLRLVSHDGDYHFYSPNGLARVLEAEGFDVRGRGRVHWHSFIVLAARR